MSFKSRIIKGTFAIAVGGSAIGLLSGCNDPSATPQSAWDDAAQQALSQAGYEPQYANLLSTKEDPRVNTTWDGYKSGPEFWDAQNRVYDVMNRDGKTQHVLVYCKEPYREDRVYRDKSDPVTCTFKGPTVW